MTDDSGLLTMRVEELPIAQFHLQLLQTAALTRLAYGDGDAEVQKLDRDRVAHSIRELLRPSEERD